MNYKYILDEKYDLRDLIEKASMEESLGEIASRLDIDLMKIADIPELTGGERFRLSGIPYGDNASTTFFDGVLWDITDRKKGNASLNLEVYDRSIYLDRSEDEYLHSKGETASDRLKKYARDWGIPLGDVYGSTIDLSKAVYRSQSLYRMIESDLRETADKGGPLLLARMTGGSLDLVEIGTNDEVWELEEVEEVTRSSSMENVVTKVKVLGKEEEDQRSPVIAEISENIDELGTLQKISQNSKAKNKSEAEESGRNMLSGIEMTKTVSCFDINTVRAGDKIVLNDETLYVISVKRTLNKGAMMTLELGSMGHIRRKYYEAMD